MQTSVANICSTFSLFSTCVNSDFILLAELPGKCQRLSECADGSARPPVSDVATNSDTNGAGGDR